MQVVLLFLLFATISSADDVQDRIDEAKAKVDRAIANLHHADVHFFETLDSDGNGFLELPELLDYGFTYRAPTLPQQIRNAFKANDIDYSGGLDVYEFKTFYKDLKQF